jgi:hypothetical protein
MPCKTDHILTSVVLKYVNKADYYAVWKSHILILKSHIQKSK